MPHFCYSPNVILGAIIVTAAIRLIDFGAMWKLWKADKLDFLACISAFLGVLLVSVQMGLAIAVGISVFKILLHVTRPNMVILGSIPGTQIYQNIGHYKEATRLASVLIIRVESPIYFANSSYVQERTLRMVRDEEERVQIAKECTLKSIFLDLSYGSYLISTI